MKILGQKYLTFLVTKYPKSKVENDIADVKSQKLGTFVKNWNEN